MSEDTELLNKLRKKYFMMLDLVKYPVIRTEKATRLIENNQFSFDVDVRLTKPQIKKLIEEERKILNTINGDGKDPLNRVGKVSYLHLLTFQTPIIYHHVVSIPDN